MKSVPVAEDPTRGRVRLALIGVGLAISLVLSAASGASAGLVHPFASSFGSFSNPQAVAVEPTSGSIFVIDVGSATVQRFDSSGNPSIFSAIGSNTLNGVGGADATPEAGFSFDSNSAAQLAVDTTGGSTAGYLYVTNSLAGVIDVFDATGTFVGEIDGSAASPQSGGEVCGVATDPAGHVYASYFSGHVDKYTPTDSNPAHDTFDTQLQNLGGVCNVASDGLGAVYVSTWATGPLTKYDASQFGQGSPSGTDLDSTSLAVAVDPSTNDVFVDHGDHVAQYDSTGALLGQSGTGHLSGNSFGVAVDTASGLLYASDTDTGTVQQYGPAVNVAPPSVTVDQPSSVTSTHATFTGTVNPQGTGALSDTTWHIAYSTDGGNSFTSTLGGSVGAGTSPVQVGEQITGFSPNQGVQARLVATNAAGTAESPTVSVMTSAIPPSVTTQQAQDLAPTHAALQGLVNPNNSPTTYYFEYGATTAYGTSIPANGAGDAHSSTAIGGVVERIGGLVPGSTYHFRLVATSQAGTTHGQDQTFITTSDLPGSTARAGIPGTGFLPDQRAWEKVSPDDKNGGDVMAASARVRVATNASAITFASLAAFGDAISTSVATEYMSSRSPNGWTTHAITPRQAPLTIRAILSGLQSIYIGPLSDDLSTGVFRAWSPLTTASSVANVTNIYLRNDLRNPGAGFYQLLSDCPLCQGTNTPLPAPVGNGDDGQPYVTGASADFRHVIFESQEPLTTDAPTGCVDLTDTNQCPGNLYESDHGTVRLVGILPDSECPGAPPCAAHGSQAGQGAGSFQGALELTPHAISADGSRIFFTAPDSPGSRGGGLYLRLDHSTTVRLNASERTTPDSPSSAFYWDASTDGSRVFFTTTEPLTNDAAANSGGISKLYMYDTTKPDSDSHNLTLISTDSEPADTGSVETVLGASRDGHYVYFLAAGQLIAGQPVSSIDRGIYAWHDGAIRYIASVGGSDPDDDSAVTDWGLHPPTARVSPDGTHLVFSSAIPSVGPTGYNQTCHVQGGGICGQLYDYNYDSQRLACVSCSPSGTAATGSAFMTVRTNNGSAANTWTQTQSMSADGRRVFFSTPDGLAAQDVNSKIDVYEYDVPTGTLHLITSGRDLSDSYFMNASPSGDDVFFVTRAQLVGADVDNNYDLYDARVNGGFAEGPPGSPTCTAEACRPPQSTAPSVSIPGSSQIASKDSGKRATKRKPTSKPCRKGYVRKQVRGKPTCKRKKLRHKTRKAKRPKRVNVAPRRPR